jgi:hypothetical protein
MTPEEKAREIADIWLMDAEVNGFLSAQEDGGLAKAIATAIRGARNAALEEAAAWVREYQRVDGKRAAEGILALKDKQEVTEEEGA